MNADAVREVLAGRLWPKAAPSAIAEAVQDWVDFPHDEKWILNHPGEHRDPLESHDTIHAIRATLTPEEKFKFICKIHAWAERS